jgi:DNA-binding MarR family transcriptional regulator
MSNFACYVSRVVTRGFTLAAMSQDQDQDKGNWTLLTAHGRALVAIAQDPDARMRDLAEIVGVTERTVQAIVADLETAGYVAHTRIGRRNRYTVHLDRPFRHPAQDGHLIGPLLDTLGTPGPGNE